MMDPYAVDARLPLRRFVLFFADDASDEAQELFDRLARLGFTGRLYNDAELLALEADEYRRTELAVRNSQYWFVYATESFFAERGFLEQHRGELLARTAQRGHLANRLIPIFCKPKSQYKCLAWGFGGLSGLVCTDRYFESAVTGLLKSAVAEKGWQDLEEGWQQALLALQADEATRRKQQLELAALKLKDSTAAAAIADAGIVGSATESGWAAHSDVEQCGRPRRPEVTPSSLGPAQVIYNISVNANQSTLQIGDSNASHYYSPSVLSQIHPTSSAGVMMEGLPYLTGVEGFSNYEPDVNGGEATSRDPAGASAAQRLLAQSDGEPVSVVDSGLHVLGSGNTEMPSIGALPAFGAISDSSTGGFIEQATRHTTTLTEAVVDRSMTEPLADLCIGVSSSELPPTEGEARAISISDPSTGDSVERAERPTTTLAEEVVDRSMTEPLADPYTGMPNSGLLLAEGEARVIPISDSSTGGFVEQATRHTTTLAEEVVDRSMTEPLADLCIGVSSSELPPTEGEARAISISDPSTGDSVERAERPTTTLAEEVVDRSMTEPLADPYTGMPNSGLLPAEGEARVIPVNAAFITVTPSEGVHPEGTAV